MSVSSITSEDRSFSDVCKRVFPLRCELWVIYFAHVAIGVKIFLMNLISAF